MEKLLKSFLQLLVGFLTFLGIEFGFFPRQFEPVAERTHHAADEIEDNDFRILID